MHLTIPKKISLPFFSIIILMTAVCIFSLKEMSDTQNSIKHLINETQKEKELCEFQSYVASLLIAVNDFILTGDKKYYKDYTDFDKKARNRISQLELLLDIPQERTQLNHIENILDSIRIAIPHLLAIAKKHYEDSVDILLQKLDFKYDDSINITVAEFIQFVKENVKKAYSQTHKEREEAFRFIIISVAIAIIISILVVLMTMRRISKPLIMLIHLAQKIAARDFSVELRAKENDEIGMLIVAFKAMADEISKRYEELENFSYIAAHDLKTPLTGVMGCAEILLDEYKDKINQEDAQLLHDIYNSGKKMTSLITDLLEFATAGKIEFSKKPISMNTMLDEIESELNYIIKKQKVKLIIEENLPSFICDPIKISQVWNNLISNSIKYNDKTEVFVEIGLKKSKNLTNEFCFFVKDNGIGIDESYFNKIFNPFQRAVNNTQYKGTGIGLAIVKKNYRISWR